jgi:hypothetical protein
LRGRRCPGRPSRWAGSSATQCCPARACECVAAPGRCRGAARVTNVQPCAVRVHAVCTMPASACISPCCASAPRTHSHHTRFGHQPHTHTHTHTHPALQVAARVWRALCLRGGHDGEACRVRGEQ